MTQALSLAQSTKGKQQIGGLGLKEGADKQISRCAASPMWLFSTICFLFVFLYLSNCCCCFKTAGMLSWLARNTLDHADLEFTEICLPSKNGG